MTPDDALAAAAAAAAAVAAEASKQVEKHGVYLVRLGLKYLYHRGGCMMSVCLHSLNISCALETRTVVPLLKTWLF